MQIVIEIPESVYETIKEEEVGNVVYKAIKNGTPLPKGHGDLKDSDKLKNAFIKWSMVVQGCFTDSDIASIVYNSPTIIEADKSESENKK
jgi:hypothetical protein